MLTLTSLIHRAQKTACKYTLNDAPILLCSSTIRSDAKPAKNAVSKFGHLLRGFSLASALVLGCTMSHADDYVIAVDVDGVRHYAGADGTPHPLNSNYFKTMDFTSFSPSLIWSLEDYAKRTARSFDNGGRGQLWQVYNSTGIRFAFYHEGKYPCCFTTTSDTQWYTDNLQRIVSTLNNYYFCRRSVEDTTYGWWMVTNSTINAAKAYKVTYTQPAIDEPFLPANLHQGESFTVPLSVSAFYPQQYLIDGKYYYSYDSGATYPESSTKHQLTENCTVSYAISGTGAGSITNNTSTGTITFSSDPGVDNRITVSVTVTPTNTAYSPFTFQREVQLYTATPLAPAISITASGSTTIAHRSNNIISSDIFYTTDGTAPTTSSTHYSGAFNITSGTTVKAIAVNNGVSSTITEEQFVTSDYVFVYTDGSGHRHYIGSNAANKVNNPSNVSCYKALDLTIIDNSCVWSCRNYSSGGGFGSPMAMTTYGNFNFVQQISGANVYLSKNSGISNSYVYIDKSNPTMATWYYDEQNRLKYNTASYSQYLTHGSTSSAYGNWLTSTSTPNIQAYPVQKTEKQDFDFTASLSSTEINNVGGSITISSSASGNFLPEYYYFNNNYYYNQSGSYDTESTTAPTTVSTYQYDYSISGDGAAYVTLSENEITCQTMPGHDVYVTVTTTAYPTGFNNAVKSKQLNLVIKSNKPTAPSINMDLDGHVSMSTVDAAEIYYTTTGDIPTSSSTKYVSPLSGIATGTTITAISVKGGVSSDVATGVSTNTTGIAGATVILDDLEDHNWNYYQAHGGIDAKYEYPDSLVSLDPRNVKITYNGLGLFADDNSQVTSGVAVSGKSGENQNQFIYYETLEKDNWISNTYYPYTVIPNPFTVRPSRFISGQKVYYGNRKWKLTRLTGGSIKLSNGNSVHVGDFIDGDTDVQLYPSSSGYTANCISMEIEFTAYWEVADRVIVNNSDAISYSGLTKNARELNFLVLNRNTSSQISNGAVPMTVMMTEPDGAADYRTVANNQITKITLGAGEFKIENSVINYPVNSGALTYPCTVASNLFDNKSSFEIGEGIHSVIFGRGLMPASSNGLCIQNFRGVNADSKTINAAFKYRLRLESGVYQRLEFTRGNMGEQNYMQTISDNGPLDIKPIIGCDYDRAKNDNNLLKVKSIVQQGAHFISGSVNYGKYCMFAIFKSGTMMSDRALGGAHGSLGEVCYLACSGNSTITYLYGAEIQGGEFTNMNLGPWYTSGSLTDNQIGGRLRIKGGLFKGSIYLGAATSPTYGSRKLVITGGTVKGWIGGGCNGESEGGQTGGRSFIYVGGNTRVDSEGSETKINQALGGNVFGAGCGVATITTAGEMTLGSNVVVSDNAYVERDVYGGGNYGYAKQKTKMFILNGQINGNIFGGGNQNKTACDDVIITMMGGKVGGGIYGGCNSYGTINYNTDIRIIGGTIGASSSTANIHGGGYGASTQVNGNVSVSIGLEPTGSDKTVNKDSISKLTIYGDVYGGSALGKTNTVASKTTAVNMYSGTVNGNIYGGALGAPGAAAVIGATSQTVDIYGGKVTGGVYGGSNINANMTASVKPRQGVTIHNTWKPTTAGEYAIGSVFGGGNGETAANSGQPGAHDTHTDGTFVTVDSGYVGNIFGGGNAATAMKTTVTVNNGTVGNIYGGSNKANIGGTTSITVNGGTIDTGIYGGCNTQGNVSGTTTVNILGGTIGKSDAMANIHGGGFGQVTTTGSDVTVNVGALSSGHGSTTGPSVYADVYGGSALGSVGAALTDTAYVNIYSGSVYGNVYGGGLGRQDDTTTVADESIKAVVSGSTLVSVYKAHFGPNSEIFGGNNLNGSPVGSTTVHVYETEVPSFTDHIGENQPTFPGESTDNPWNQYAIKGVYGGSNKALFHTTDAPGQTNVIVDDCASSIAYVYGGSNAADVYGSTAVTINGAGKIGVVFGGGNGAGAGNPGANVLKGTDGTGGNTVTNIYGGVVDFTFGGSNTLGDVKGTATVNLEDNSGACSYLLGEVYGAGNAAPMTGSPDLNIGCIDSIGSIYGGARNADLSSDVTLNIHNGKFSKIFGGNNLGGTLSGAITINIEETGCSPIRIDELYGCGNMAAYTTPSGKADPQIKIKSATYIGSVYGGGLGASATVTGSPVVDINMEQGVLNKGKSTAATQPMGTIGNVFGGGNAAVLKGNSTIKLATTSGKDAPITGNVYGGGNLAAVQGNTTVNAAGGSAKNLFGGGNQAGIEGSTTVNLKGTNVTDSIYGGCNTSGTVTKSTTVCLTAGRVGGSVFGGGFGQATDVDSISVITLNGDTVKVLHDIYGGSALGSVTGTAVTVTKGTVGGDVYGGGLGSNTAGNLVAAVVNGNVKVTVDGGKIGGSVYGCNNRNGSPVSTSKVQVDINATPSYTLAAVYGGGNVANSNVTPVLNINNCDVSIGSVYGGGNAAATNGTNATIWGGTIGSAFGGGNGTTSAANVNGKSSLTIHGGTIGSVYAGSNTNGVISDTMKLSIDHVARPGGTLCDENISEVYGGGNKAPGKGAVITIGCGTGYLGNIYGGSKDADIEGDLTLNIKGGEIDTIFGGNNVAGAIKGGITVNIDIAECTTAKIKNVYGGGNLASYTAPDTASNYPKINLISGKIGWTDSDGKLLSNGGGNVFGGGFGESAVVKGNPVVNLCSDATHTFSVLGSIYGGGDAAGVTGNTTVNLTKGEVNKVFGAGLGTTAVVTGNPTVNVNGATVATDVYGGGSLASVTGKTRVNLLSGTVTGNVYGGGLGDSTSTAQVAANISDSTIVTVSGGTAANVFGCNNLLGAPAAAKVTVTDGTVTGNVYGGGNLAAAGTESAPVSPAVTVTGGSMNKVYGGGLGQTAVITGNPTVTINKAASSTMTVTDVFGGGDAASVTGSPTININAGTIANAYGGGYGAATNVTGLSTVSLNGAIAVVTGDIYGGSALGSVSGTKVTVTKGSVGGSVYGGGLGDDTHKAAVNDDVLVTVNGGKISGNVYGCNNVNGAPSDTSVVRVVVSATQDTLKAVFGGGNMASYTGTPHVSITTKDALVGKVFGGGNAADVSGTDVTIWGGTVGDAFAGGNGVVSGTAANVTGNALLTIHGGTVKRAFAGSNNNGSISGTDTVKIDQQKYGSNAQCVESVSEVYGGGNLAAGKAGVVSLDCSADSIGDVYGGANQADIKGDIVLNITKGRMKRVFGGNNTSGNIEGSITVNIKKDDGCSDFRVVNVYGGGNLADYTAPTTGSYTGNYPAVNILAGTVSEDVFGGGLKATVTGTPTVTISGGTVSRDVYGGGSLAAVTGKTSVTLASGTVTGNIYGGGLGDASTAANVSDTTRVYINGGSAANVFGCNNVNGAPQKGAKVLVSGGTVNAGVFGGGNLANADINPQVTISGGTMDKVFGGGNQASADSTIITVTGGTVTTGVYGGCNATGTAASALITLTDGTIGSVFGGGYGEPTVVSGNVDVNIGTINAGVTSGTATITGDVYGGSALGTVGTSGVKTNHTNVTLNAGSVGGSIYGGGLGRKADSGASPAVTAVEAKVYSPVQVTMNGGTISGDIFGCNNLNGAPQDTVRVDINATAAHQSEPLVYAVRAVYGGGNLAAYSRTPAVSINNCDASIGSVYGGGNAAATGGTNATIWGGIIGNAFGGGNGESGTAADVNGDSRLNLYGGTITNAFAGSNMHGEIKGTMKLQIGGATVTGPCSCDLKVTNTYGGGNQAASQGAEITIGCGAGYLGNVYGGAKAADISGGLTLNIEGGQIDNVFGGNDQSGEIGGDITVNIKTGGCTDAWIKNVYGGGNMAAFTHNTTVNLISGTVGKYDTDGVTLLGGNVFGGGLGEGAVVTGNPTVNLCSDASHSFSVLGSIYGGGDLAAVTGNTTLNLTKGTTNYAFGGGNKADVTGDTKVKLEGADAADVTVSSDIYGGGSLASVSGGTDVELISGTVSGSVYGGGLGQASGDATPAIAANVSTSTVELKGATVNNIFGCNNVNGAPQTSAVVTVASGEVTGNVYGGGNLAAASLSPSVSLTGGTITGDVFGAGLGASAVITGNPTVTVNGGTVSRDVYGGGSQASVKGNTSVAMTTGSVGGNIYGGGLGKTAMGDSIAANVSGTTTVNVNGGTVTGSVFGCNNLLGAPAGVATVTVDMESGSVNGNVYGGGNQAAYTGSATVNLTQGTVAKAFGGGYGSTAIVKGNPTVNLTGATVGNVFGGGDEASLEGDPQLSISGGKATQIFGGGNKALVTGNPAVSVTGGTHGTIFGGGNEANVDGTPTVTVTGASTHITGNVFGGGNQGNVSGSPTVTIGE